jgi:hypothetical protein
MVTIWIGGWSKRCSVSKERDTIHPGAWPPVRAEQEEEQRDEAVIGFVGLVALPSFPLSWASVCACTASPWRFPRARGRISCHGWILCVYSSLCLSAWRVPVRSKRWWEKGNENDGWMIRSTVCTTGRVLACTGREETELGRCHCGAQTSRTSYWETRQPSKPKIYRPAASSCPAGYFFLFYILIRSPPTVPLAARHQRSCAAEDDEGRLFFSLAVAAGVCRLPPAAVPSPLPHRAVQVGPAEAS